MSSSENDDEESGEELEDSSGFFRRVTGGSALRLRVGPHNRNLPKKHALSPNQFP